MAKNRAPSKLIIDRNVVPFSYFKEALYNGKMVSWHIADDFNCRLLELLQNLSGANMSRDYIRDMLIAKLKSICLDLIEPEFFALRYTDDNFECQRVEFVFLPTDIEYVIHE